MDVCARALVVAVAFAAMPRLAHATCEPITGACIDSDTLWPHAGPTQFMSLSGSETTAIDRISFGLVATYLRGSLVFHSSSPGPLGSDRYVIENQIDTTFLFAYGVTDRLELDLALPVTVFQDGGGASVVAGATNGLPPTASRDMRFGVTYAFLRPEKKHPWRHDASGFGIAARFETVAPTGDENAFAAERAAVFVPSLSLDWRGVLDKHSRSIFAGVEIGARIRPETDFIGARIGTQGIIAVGAGLDILSRGLLSVTGELRFLPVFTSQADVTVNGGSYTSTSNGAYITPAEWMVTLRSAPLEGGDFSLQLGAGGWLPTANFQPATTPIFRMAFGVAFAPRGRDTDGDGVPDAADKCPLEPGSKSSGEGAGCPERATPP